MDPRQLLVESFHAALAAADAATVVPGSLPPPPKGRTLVLGAGKAAAAMALAVEQHWPTTAHLDGLVTTRYGHGMLTNRIKVVEAGHPVPDEAGTAAARQMLHMAAMLGKDDLLLVLLSGGGSSLLSLPAGDVKIHDLRVMTGEMLRCGVPIEEMNVVRKHLSSILGGQLAAASRAPTKALIISDVTGDDPTHIASGPCAPDPSTFEEALDVIGRYCLKAPDAVIRHLSLGARAALVETPKPEDDLFMRVENRVVAGSQTALLAAAAFFRTQGVASAILGDSVTGEASDVAKVYGALARQVAKHNQPWPAPIALISGGECTVTVRGRGRGGRCSEFLLALARNLAGARNIWALACDTDGIDGSEDNAGAILTPDSLIRASRCGMDVKKFAADNDSWTFFHALNDLVMTGPTRTNVSDYRVILLL